MNHQVLICAVGGPTVVLELAGLRLLTDPTFDPPGEYPVGTGRLLVKTAPPALTVEAVGPVDAVLLSHDRHPDNLDAAGRALLHQVPHVLTTRAAAARLPGTTGLAPWAHAELGRRDTTGVLRVTAVPAQYGPDGTERLAGEVVGFVLQGERLPTVYVGGDNASLRVVREVAGRFPSVDVAILHAGGARTPLLGDAHLTPTGEMAAEAARILRAPHVVPVHLSGWKHLAEGEGAVREAFARIGLTDELVMLKPGEAASVALTFGVRRGGAR